MAFVSRYQSRTYFRNIDPLYAEKIRDRDRSNISMYTTPSLGYPTEEEIGTLISETRVWAIGSSYSKLAYEFYGDPELWWIIGWFNKKPAEFMVKVGDIISIPMPLEKVLGYYGV